MKKLIALEELFLALLAFYLFMTLDYAWWLFFALFFVPDLSMLGYVFGSNAGALTYNLAHHKGIAIALFLLGSTLQAPALQLAGTILLAHSSFDRVLGYGLKYADSFQNTHLGRIGRPAA